MIKYKKGLYAYEGRYYSCKGSRFVDECVIDFPPTGGVALKKVGERPLYEQIQANLSNCDLQSVIESCVHTNQYAVCSSDNLNTMVQDFVGLHNLGDIYVASKRIEHTWKDLPLEVREEFGSDLKQFISSIGSDEFNKKVSDGFSRFDDNISKIHLSPTPDVVLKPEDNKEVKE